MTLGARLWRNSAFRFGAVVLAALLFIAVFSPLLGTVDPSALDSAQINTAAGVRGDFALPGGISVLHTFWMGTDNFGRDIYSRVLYGTRTSLLVAGFTMLVAVAIGATLGMIAGYFRAVDTVLMRVMDGLMAIPVGAGPNM